MKCTFIFNFIATGKFIIIITRVLYRANTVAGDQALPNAGPALWNSLSDSCRKANSLESFKNLLNTLVFFFFWGGFKGHKCHVFNYKMFCFEGADSKTDYCLKHLFVIGFIFCDMDS